MRVMFGTVALRAHHPVLHTSSGAHPGQEAGSAGGSWAAPALDAAPCSGAAAAGASVDGPLLPAHMITPRHASGEPAEFPRRGKGCRIFVSLGAMEPEVRGKMDGPTVWNGRMANVWYYCAMDTGEPRGCLMLFVRRNSLLERGHYECASWHLTPTRVGDGCGRRPGPG